MARIRLYSTEDLDTVSHIDDVNIIINEANKIYDQSNISLLQIEGLNQIKVDGLTEAQARKIDYIVLSDTTTIGYTVIGQYKFVGSVCVFPVVVDAVGTALDDCEIIGATADRMCVDDDDEVYYTELEPFKPSEKINILGFLMDPNFPQTGNLPCTNIAETIVIPPVLYKITEGSTTKVQDGGADVDITRRRLPAGYDGYLAIGAKYRNSVPEVNIVKDNKTKVVSQISLLSIQDIQYRKMVPTYLNLKGLLTDAVATINIGARWWREQDMPSIDQSGDASMSSVINDLRDVGSDHNVTSYWSIPTYYIEAVSSSQYNPFVLENYGGISSISAKKIATTYEFRSSGIEPKNNKAKYAQTMSLTVFSPVSGNSLTKQPYEISNPENKPGEMNIKADYVITADLRPDGSPIFAWKYRNGFSQEYGVPETIQGGRWRQIPLVGEGARGGFFPQAQLNKEKDQTLGKAIGAGLGGALGHIMANAATGAAIGAGTGAAAGGVGAIPGLAIGALVGLVKGGIEYANLSIQQRDQQELLNAQGQIADAEISIAPSNYHREIGLNSFYSYWSYYSEADVAAFDRFLTLYGYKVNNKIFNKSDCYSRRHFNYVKLNNCTIYSDKWGLWMREALKEQLRAGVRIWHELPNEGAIADGNPKN